MVNMIHDCFFENEFPIFDDAIKSLCKSSVQFKSKLDTYNEIRSQIEHIDKSQPLRIDDLAIKNNLLIELRDNMLMTIATHLGMTEIHQ